MKKVLTVILVAIVGSAFGCAAESGPDDMDKPTTTPSSEDEAEATGVVESAASSCSHTTTRWVNRGCCTRTATRKQQQICIYGTWYWQTPTKCYYPTSYCI